MEMELTARQREAQAAYRTFVEEKVVPAADGYDQEETTPRELIDELASRGYLGASLPTEWGGLGLDMITFGILNEEMGRGCSSLRSLLTVHTMASHAILRWGAQAQRERWLTALAQGEKIGAFALSEPEIGSDASNIQCTAELQGDTYLLNGRKKWITYGQIADVYLLFAQVEGKPTAFLVERESPGLTVKPLRGMYGTRASMLAELHLENCVVPQENLLGRVGFGVSYVALHALDYGRYSVACGSVGIAQACLDASVDYAVNRKQFGAPLADRQLIQRMIAEMVTNVKAARLLCRRAGYLRDLRDPGAIMETSIAKYFAAKAASQAANDAVQIHGANGCSSDYSVQRFLRDSKIMEIIEGSNEMQQMSIARYGVQQNGRG